MNNKIFHYLISIVTLLFLSSSVCAQVWVMTEADNSTTYIGKNWLKSIECDEEGVSSSIYNLSKDIMILIDENQEIYAKGSSIDLCNAMKSFRDDMNKNMPASQQKMMQDMIKAEKAKPALEITVSKSNGEKIAGYQTTKYSIFINGELYEEMWITNDSELNDIIKGNKKVLKEGLKIAECSVPDEAFLRSSPEFSNEYKEVEMAGVTLKSVNYDDYESNKQIEVVSLTKEDISTSEFEAPEGYKLLSFKEYFMVTSGM